MKKKGESKKENELRQANGFTSDSHSMDDTSSTGGFSVIADVSVTARYNRTLI